MKILRVKTVSGLLECSRRGYPEGIFNPFLRETVYTLPDNDTTVRAQRELLFPVPSPPSSIGFQSAKGSVLFIVSEPFLLREEFDGFLGHGREQ